MVHKEFTLRFTKWQRQASRPQGLMACDVAGLYFSVERIGRLVWDILSRARSRLNISGSVVQLAQFSTKLRPT